MLNTFSNSDLVIRLKDLVREERKVTAQILEYLREVQARRLYLELGYSSLFEFCRKELMYSEGAAHRRISAMRLLNELPEIENKIVNGELSLSVLSQTQSFFNKKEREKEPVKKEEKLDLLASLENSSARECEQKLVELDPELAQRDRERPIGQKLVELRLTVDEGFISEVEELKDLLAHAMPFGTTKDIIVRAVREILVRERAKRVGREVPDREGVERRGREVPDRECIKRTECNWPGRGRGSQKAGLLSTSEVQKHFGQRVPIPKSVRNLVWKKAQSQCTYINPSTGHRCSSRRFLEIDHIIPVARGGTNDLANLTLLCDAHNRWKGVRCLRGPPPH